MTNYIIVLYKNYTCIRKYKKYTILFQHTKIHIPRTRELSKIHVHTRYTVQNFCLDYISTPEPPECILHHWVVLHFARTSFSNSNCCPRARSKSVGKKSSPSLRVPQWRTQSLMGTPPFRAQLNTQNHLTLASTATANCTHTDAAHFERQYKFLIAVEK